MGLNRHRKNLQKSGVPTKSCSCKDEERQLFVDADFLNFPLIASAWCCYSGKFRKSDAAYHSVLVSRQKKSYFEIQQTDDVFALNCSLLLDRRSIDLSGAQEKEGHFHYKNFLRASKWGITCHTCSIIAKSLYWGLGLSLIHSKGILGWWSRHGMWYFFSKLSKSFLNESDLLFVVHHWGQLTFNLRGM